MLQSIANGLQKRSATIIGTGIASTLALALTLTTPFAQGLPLTPPVTPPVTPPTTPTPSPSPTPTPEPGDSEIKIVTNSLHSAREGRFYFRRIQAVDKMKGSDLMIETSELPDGLELDHCYTIPRFWRTQAFCYIKGIPEEAGEFDVTIMASNSYGDFEIKELELDVKEARHWFWWH